MASIEFPLSFTRQYSGPLDTTEVFDTLVDLNTYIASNPIAYDGQVVSVIDGTTKVYLIADDPANPGTLKLSAVVSPETLDNYYTETETDDLLDTKADQSTTYTKTETDDLLDTKPSSADYDNIVQLTQTAYNNIATPVSTTLYIIVG
jgi:hypothetical protein